MSSSNGTTATLDPPAEPATAIDPAVEYAEAAAGKIGDDWLTAPEERIPLRSIPGIAKKLADDLARQQITFLSQFDAAIAHTGLFERGFNAMEEHGIIESVEAFREKRQAHAGAAAGETGDATDAAPPAAGPVETEGELTSQVPGTIVVTGAESDGGICHDAGAALADAEIQFPAGGFVAPSKPGTITSEEERQCYARHHHECQSALKRVRAAETEVESAKNVLKEAKEELEECQSILNDLVGRDPFAPTQAVLFKAEKKEAAASVDSTKAEPDAATADSAPAPVSGPAAAEDFTWRDERFDGPFFQPKLGDAMVTLLFNKDIQTMGALSDFQAKHGDFWVKEIRGLGPKKADKIADATAKFWPFHAERLKAGAGNQELVK